MTQAGFVPVRQLVLVDLLSLLLSVCPRQRAMVAIDGVDGVGKTHLVRELLALAPHLTDREVLAVSIDGFHRPRALRHAAGSTPESFYRDSYDYEAFRRAVVEPYRAGGPIRPAVFDVASDQPVDAPMLRPSGEALLLVDGIFLRRPELRDVWDATVWVKAPATVTVPRGNARFPDRPAGSEDPDHPANARYIGGQKLYLQQARVHQPTWVLDNTDLSHPHLLEPDPEDPAWFE